MARRRGYAFDDTEEEPGLAYYLGKFLPTIGQDVQQGFQNQLALDQRDDLSTNRLLQALQQMLAMEEKQLEFDEKLREAKETREEKQRQFGEKQVDARRKATFLQLLGQPTEETTPAQQGTQAPAEFGPGQPGEGGETTSPYAALTKLLRPRGIREAASESGYLPENFLTELLKSETDLQRPVVVGKSLVTPRGRQLYNEPEPFTLGQGQRRYGTRGEILAEVPAKPEKAASLGAEITAALAQLGRDPDTATADDVAAARRLVQQGRVDVSAAQGRESTRQELEPAGGVGLPGGAFAPKPGEPIGAYKARLHSEAQAGATTRANIRVQLTEVNSILDRLDELAPKAFSGVGEGIVGRGAGSINVKRQLLGQSNQEAVQFHSLAEGTLAPIIRSLGEKGTLAEGDVERARALLPTLGTGLTGLSDTPTTARNKLKQLRALMEEIERRGLSEAAPSLKSKMNPRGSIPPGVRIER